MKRFAIGPCLLLVLGCAKGQPAVSKECADLGVVYLQGGGTVSHVADCSQPCGNGANPPTGGPHCSETLTCQSHTNPPPRCQWIHNLEHGHIALLYNCPAGCPEIVDTLNSIREANPRVLVAADPELPNKVGAVVWSWSWVGAAIDMQAITCVMKQQDVEAPEPGLPCGQ